MAVVPVEGPRRISRFGQAAAPRNGKSKPGRRADRKNTMSDRGLSKASNRSKATMIKRFMFMSVMMAAVGVPYMMSASSSWLSAVKSRFSSSSTDTNAAAALDPTAAPETQSMFGGGTPLPGAPRPKGPIEGYGRYDLAELLRFDGSPEWLMQHWPRVTVGLAEPELQGYRIPLVTGTTEQDVAGSLTYYFDRNRRVKMVHLRGTTGNPHMLVNLVTQQYGLVRQPTSDPSLILYQRKWNGKPTSELRVRTARVLRADQPLSRFQVELALKRL
jgi:Family of unknown function (DUF6690)